jgi:hypothetical protein
LIVDSLKYLTIFPTILLHYYYSTMFALDIWESR